MSVLSVVIVNFVVAYVFDKREEKMGRHSTAAFMRACPVGRAYMTTAYWQEASKRGAAKKQASLLRR